MTRCLNIITNGILPLVNLSLSVNPLSICSQSGFGLLQFDDCDSLLNVRKLLYPNSPLFCIPGKLKLLS